MKKLRTLAAILICFCGKTFPFSQDVLFDSMNLFQIPQNLPFSATIDIQKVGNVVSITIPAMTFSFPSYHANATPLSVINASGATVLDYDYPVIGGTLYLKSGAIPKAYRPPSAIGATAVVTASGGLDYNMLAVVTEEGNIRFTYNPHGALTPGYSNLIGAGPYSINSVTVSYSLPSTVLSPSVNFIISEGFAQTFRWQSTQLLLNQYLDGYFSDIRDGKIVSYWLDTTTAASFAYGSLALARTGTVSYDGDTAVVTQDPITTAVSPGSTLSCTQGSVSINPTNSSNIVLNTVIVQESGSPQLWAAVSNNGGTSWASSTRIDQGSIPPNKNGDNNGIFDRFGNYWITNIGGSSTTKNLVILVSSDGGQTFSVAAQIDPTAAPFNGSVNSLFDFNQMAFGGDGNGGWALYFVNDFYNPTGFFYPCIGYIPVTGLGAYGSYTIVGMTSLSYVELGNLTVSDTGEIFINYASLTSSDSKSTYTNYYFFNKSGGINGLVDGSLSGPYYLAMTNIGIGYQSTPGIGTTYTGSNAKGIRGQIPNTPVRGLAYDNTKGALYALVYNKDPIFSQHTQLYLVASINNGVTWSRPYQIKNNPLGNCFLANISIDPVRGDVFVTWYDSSADQPANQFVQFYGAILTSAQLDVLLSEL